MSEGFMVFKIVMIFYFLVKVYKENKSLNKILKRGNELRGKRVECK